MRQILATSAIILAIAVTVNCQLFNEIQPPVRGRSNPSKGRGGDNGLLKTFTFDTLKLNERPGTKNGYLPPEPPTYLPPKEVPSSTNGPTYLPPSTTRPPIYTNTYMPTMGTFPSTRIYNYTTHTTTTYKPIKAPSTLPPLTTTRLTTQGYSYNKPELEFSIEDLRRSKKF